MESAMDTLIKKLLLIGMDTEDIDHLLARFLQEEAFQYVEYVCKGLKDLNTNTEIKKKFS